MNHFPFNRRNSRLQSIFFNASRVGRGGYIEEGGEWESKRSTRTASSSFMKLSSVDFLSNFLQWNALKGR